MIWLFFTLDIDADMNTLELDVVNVALFLTGKINSVLGQGVVEVEEELGHASELLAHSVAKDLTHLLVVLLDLFECAFGVRDSHEAQVHLSGAQIGRHAHLGDRDEAALKQVTALALEDHCQFALEQARYFFLPNACHSLQR